MSDQQPIDLDWLTFRGALERAIGVPLAQYKEPQMKRRLASLMGRHGLAAWSDFTAAIRTDPALLAAVRDTLTINVSEFFRQADRFDWLAKSVLPEMVKAGRPLRIWSAGCSIGCEPYTLAIVLDQIDSAKRHTIIATDVDVPILARATAGKGYLPAEVRSVPAPFLQKYFRATNGTYEVVDDIRRRVTFRRQDLLSDPYPAELDLILCRNVVIYFNEDAKQFIYTRFSKALRPNGLLFVGGSEMIMRSQEIGFRTVATSMYRKAA
jgi:chemotaxis protein methyltransferase CheR